MSFRLSSTLFNQGNRYVSTSLRKYCVGLFAKPDFSVIDLDTVTPPVLPISSAKQLNKNHLGLWYSIDRSLAQKLYSINDGDPNSPTHRPRGLPPSYLDICDTLDETAVMVREPALSVIDYIERSDLSAAPNKFMFYGEDGNGKSLSIAHVLHHLYEQEWIIVYLSWPANWRRIFRKRKSIAQLVESTSSPGKYVHPLQANLWLNQFKSQNTELITKLGLTTSNSYEWSRRETLDVGSSIMGIVDQGISKSKNATDCVYQLVMELKNLASNDKCKVAFVSRGTNSLFQEFCSQKVNYVTVNAQDFVLHDAFKELLKPDWKNGVVIGSLSAQANSVNIESCLPRYLLGTEGWEALDPFVPINVPLFSSLEVDSLIDYYVSRRWIHHPECVSPDGRRELKISSGCNPRALVEFMMHL